MDKIVQLDKELFLFLNELGSAPFDAFWLIITQQIYWTPFFIAVFYLLQRKIGWKNLGIILLFLAVLLTCTDQITNVFKNGFQRLRPCNDLTLEGIRKVMTRHSFSFFSGHAANSMASSMFIYLNIRNHYQHTYLLFLFPVIFAYSRIYLGLHFPGDILTGYFFGGTFGIVFYKLYLKFNKKYNFIK